MAEQLSLDLVLERPDLDFLKMIASALINEKAVTGMSFCLEVKDKKPYVAFYGDVNMETVAVIGRALNTAQAAHKQLWAEQVSSASPVEKAVEPQQIPASL